MLSVLKLGARGGFIGGIGLALEVVDLGQVRGADVAVEEWSFLHSGGVSAQRFTRADHDELRER